MIYHFKEHLKGNLLRIKTCMYVLFLKMKYNLKTRIFLVKKFYQFGCISVVQRAFRTEYKNESAPSHSIIKNIISNFEKTGSVGHATQKQKKTRSYP